MALLHELSMCAVQVSLESRVNPKYLTVVTNGMVEFITFKGLSSDHLRFLVNMIAWDLRALSLTPMVEHHEFIVLRYCWHLALIVGISIPPIRIARSSAKACIKAGSSP